MEAEEKPIVISLEQAYNIIMDNAPSPGSEWVILKDSLQRVLSEDVTADRDMPPFNKSAVDGYACVDPRSGEELKILEIVPAGSSPTQPVKPGNCSKIMTGAEVPENTSMVVMVEHVKELGSGTIRIVKTGNKSNVAKKGEDFRTGDVIVPAHTLIGPQHIAVMASVGKVQPLVSKLPEINLITTGSELVEPDEEPGPGQIRNTNAIQLQSQLLAMGLCASYDGIVQDTKNAVLKVLSESLENNHLTIVTGGVSMGDYDFVPDMLEKCGVDILFHKIAIKPGKPTLFGRRGKHLVIGLPGNPVSTFVQFELLIKPLLYKMMGTDYKPAEIKMPLGIQIKQKRSDRDSWKPVKLEDGHILPVEYHGSAHIHALQEADGFIRIPAGTEILEKGILINVRQV